MIPTITVDVGTTSVKLGAFDAAGAVTVLASHPTPTVSDGWGTIYDTSALTAFVLDFVRALDPATRRAVGRIAVTGVGESGGLVRPDLSLASPMIVWHDHRGRDVLDTLREEDRQRFYAVAGLPVNANYGLSKVAWAVRAAKGDAEGSQWLNVAEYLAAHLTGERWSEYSLASRTMALDLRTRRWSDELCHLVGLDTHWFPALRSATDGRPLLGHRAAELGLGDDVVVHVAGHDHMVGGVGADLQPGELLNSTGTTEGLLHLAGSPRTDPSTARTQLANGISCTGVDYTLFASIPTGGSAFATLQSLLDAPAASLISRISEVFDGYTSGRFDFERMPVVLPQFRGSPPPTKRASARGVIVGLSSDTSADDLVFACFAGMALQFRDVLDLFDVRPASIKVIGPASRNPLWLQLKADLLGTPLSVSRFPQVVSRGAQALASGAAGSWDPAETVEVNPDATRGARLRAWADDVLDVWQRMKALS
jgi:sugar (pentulose or hexulose) kinase